MPRDASGSPTTCDVISEEACEAAGGVYQGDETLCEDVECPDQAPARWRVSDLVPGDLDWDGAVDVVDLVELLQAFGSCGRCPEDLDGDGIVGVRDVTILLARM